MRHDETICLHAEAICLHVAKRPPSSGILQWWRVGKTPHPLEWVWVWGISQGEKEPWGRAGNRLVQNLSWRQLGVVLLLANRCRLLFSQHWKHRMVQHTRVQTLQCASYLHTSKSDYRWLLSKQRPADFEIQCVYERFARIHFNFSFSYH